MPPKGRKSGFVIDSRDRQTGVPTDLVQESSVWRIRSAQKAISSNSPFLREYRFLPDTLLADECAFATRGTFEVICASHLREHLKTTLQIT
jgi:hypothetical protein